MTGEIYRLYRPPGLPTQIFIGPDGAVRSFVLAPLTLAGAIAQVEAILPPAGRACLGPSSAAQPERAPVAAAVP